MIFDYEQIRWKSIKIVVRICRSIENDYIRDIVHDVGRDPLLNEYVIFGIESFWIDLLIGRSLYNDD